jgi:hypothetical protein
MNAFANENTSTNPASKRRRLITVVLVLIAGLLLGHVLFTVMRSNNADPVGAAPDPEERDLTHEEMLRIMAESQDDEPESGPSLSGEEMLQLMSQPDEPAEEVNPGAGEQSDQLADPSLTAAEMLAIMNQPDSTGQDDSVAEAGLEAAEEPTVNDSEAE